MDDEIAGRIERLSPEARALFWEVVPPARRRNRVPRSAG